VGLKSLKSLNLTNGYPNNKNNNKNKNKNNKVKSKPLELRSRVKNISTRASNNCFTRGGLMCNAGLDFALLLYFCCSCWAEIAQNTAVSAIVVQFHHAVDRQQLLEDL
jgi:hypothetical protein